ncbi:MAG: flagellar biosynthesis protein FlhF [Bdellovibrionota bacterium]
MRVKKFEAKSMKDALQMVKKELGPDAVILSARDNRRSFGLGGEASVEITAAVSENTLQKKRFTESRLTAQDREKFQNSDARTQRRVIEKMVDRRIEQNQRDEAVRRPATTTSYIDIPDEELEQTPRRSAALQRASGRRVTDLLQDFEQDFEEAPQRQPARRQPRIEVQPEEPGVADRAMARIRTAAREAWKNNPFAEEEQQAPAPRRREAIHRDDIDDQDEFTPTPPAAARPRPTTPSPAGAYGSAAAAQARAVVAQARQANQAGSHQAPRTPQAPASRLGRVIGGVEMIEENYANMAPVAPQENATQRKEIDKLQGEISRLNQVLEGFQKVPQTFTTLHPGADYGIPYDFSFMFQRLQEAGVSIENSVEILKQAEREIDPMNAKKRPIVDAWVARWFLSNVRTVATPFQGRLHLFVGGSGSGKTSSLVKMAAQLVVKEKKKVAVLTTDSRKVGSIDQMKIYCQILNVPFAVIRNKTDWEWVLNQLRGVDHVLVDFPGLQLKDLEEIQYLKSLLPPEGLAPITHLCVSATTKDSDADEMARRYKVTDPSDLVFTNLDQSVQHGIIINLQKRTGLPLHSFGIGGRIPEDYEPASKERVLDLIFKLTKLKGATA